MRSSASQNWLSESVEVLALFGIAIERRRSGFARDGVIEVRAQSAELAMPCRQRIGLAAVQHVAHGEADGVEVVLNAQKEQGVGAIAVDAFRLQTLQSMELQDRVSRIQRHGGQRDGEPPEETDCRRPSQRHSALT